MTNTISRLIILLGSLLFLSATASAVDFSFTDTEGDAHKLSQYKGKWVLVNFWATWCPPCIAEMPAFEKLYQDYKNDVVFLFVANDDPKKVKKFITDKNYSHPVYYQLTEAPKEMLSNSLPTTYIINKQGDIVVDKTGAADWNSGKVRDMLDVLIKE